MRQFFQQVFGSKFLTSQASVAILYPLVAAGALALIAALIAARTAKRNVEAQNDLAAKIKLAEFRQAWINDLRNCLSSLMFPQSPAEADIRWLHTRTAKIRLLMPNHDFRYPTLDALLGRLLVETDQIDRVQTISELIPLCQAILKKEWEQLKSDVKYKAQEHRQTEDQNAQIRT